MLIACFYVFVMSILNFSILEQDHVDQKEKDANWVFYYGKMFAIAARLYIQSVTKYYGNFKKCV